jgi:hypothetical protein
MMIEQESTDRPKTETRSRRGFGATRIIAAVALAALGCSSSSDGASSSDAGATSAPINVADFVFNEFNASGATEWLEIANKGTSDMDLGNYALADTDKSTGLPKTSGLLRFPTGTKLVAHGYLLVVMGKDNAAVGPYTGDACVSGAASSCYDASFSLSAKSGEAIHLLDAADAVVTSTSYPQNLTLADGQTACRLPDTTGDFAACRATPGAANLAP